MAQTRRSKKDDDAPIQQTAPARSIRRLVGIKANTVILLLCLLFAVVVVAREAQELEYIDESINYGQIQPQTASRSRSANPKMMMASSSMDGAPEMMMADEMMMGGGGPPSPGLGHDILQFMEDEAKNKAKPEDVERMLIKNGNVGVDVAFGSLASHTDFIMASLKSTKTGYVESENENSNYNGHHQWDGSGKKVQYGKSLFFTMRVPVEQFAEFKTKILTIGEVFESSTNARDVTDQYIDSVARSETIEATRKSLLQIMEKATITKDVLAVQRELTTVTANLESQKQQMKYLKTASSLSTLSVQLREMKISEEQPNPLIIWSPSNTVNAAFKKVSKTLRLLVDVFIYFSIFGLLFAVPLIFLVKKLFDRSSSSTDNSEYMMN